MPGKLLRIGLVGYGFMGRTHSNAFRQVNHFFDLEYQPVLKAVCARDAGKARAFDTYFGYEGRYVVRDGTVRHQIAIAPDPALTGVESVRHVQLEEDRLVLSGPDFAAASPRSHRIVWRRARAG